MKKRTGELIHGVGINDVDYTVQVLRTIGYDEDGKQIQKLEWCCPYHRTWKDMLKRCYSEAFLRTTPSYRGCTVSEHWLTFSNFKSWMMTQDWHGKQLDKDILFTGNKIYSPDTCVFVSSRINTFLLGCEKGRGEFPIGVHWDTRRKVFVAKVRTGDGKRKHLGHFNNKDDAHNAWVTAKLQLAKNIAAEILEEGGDQRVASAIVRRYENYIPV